MIAINIDLLRARMTDCRAESFAVYPNGSMRVFHRWGTVDFDTENQLQQWIETGVLPNGVRSKFAVFDPAKPN